jgi:hypothetical protein
MVNVGIFYDHLKYFMAIWHNLWPFGIVSGHLLYFSQFGMFGPRKIWQPCPKMNLRVLFLLLFCAACQLWTDEAASVTGDKLHDRVIRGEKLSQEPIL